MKLPRNSLIYLAQPYSHRYKYKRYERFVWGCHAAASIMEKGYNVFSPIAHSHSIEVHGMDKIRTGKFWLKQDFAILRGCDAMIVLCLKGWDKSKGVKKEIAFAKDHQIPVYYMKG